MQHDQHALTTKSGDSFWTTVLRSLEAEPRKAKIIRGASGIDHPVLAAAVDESRRRLIVVSADIDCRTAALAQADIQSTMQNVQVLTIRPLAWAPGDATKSRTSEELGPANTESGTHPKRKSPTQRRSRSVTFWVAIFHLHTRSRALSYRSQGGLRVCPKGKWTE